MISFISSGSSCRAMVSTWKTWLLFSKVGWFPVTHVWLARKKVSLAQTFSAFMSSGSGSLDFSLLTSSTRSFGHSMAKGFLVSKASLIAAGALPTGGIAIISCIPFCRIAAVTAICFTGAEVVFHLWTMRAIST